MADGNPPIPGFGTTPVNQVLTTTSGKKEKIVDTSKYSELFNAFRDANYPTKGGSPDSETGLEWDNIEGEVMGAVLTQDIISGTPFVEVDHPFFNFASPKQCLDKLFADTFVERVASNVYLMPSVSVMGEKLNRLMISYQRQGRLEMVQMVQALQLSLSEQERNDPLKSALRGGRL